MHRAVEIVGIVFVVIGGSLGVLLMLYVALMLISSILDRLRAFKAAIRNNRFVRKVFREIKRRRLGFKKHDSRLFYPRNASPLNASYFDQIGIYHRDTNWGD